MGSNRVNDDAEAVREVVHWMVITAAHDPLLQETKDKFARDLARNDSVNMLTELGCDKDKLLSTLAFANKMPDLYPPLDAQALRNLARDLDDVLRRMKRLTPSIALLWTEESADGKHSLTLKPTGGDLHVWPELECELRCKVETYEALARLCELRKIPTRATFRKFAYLWPIQYINSCLQKEHYAEASELLCLTGNTKNTKQLIVAFNKARKQYPSVLRWMELATTFLHETGGSRRKSNLKIQGD
jgi:hypothetical protein